MLRPLVCILPLLALLGGCAPAATAPIETPEPPAAAARDTIVLLGTTDVHNRLYPYDYYAREPIDYSLGHLKPLIDSVRAVHAGSTYLFDSGDLLQGNPLGFLYARRYGDQPNPVIRAMNLLGYDASAIGNHEFNYGLGHLGAAIEQADFPFVSANVFRAGTDDHAYIPYVLLPHVTNAGDTLLIGVTGNTPPGVHVWDRAHVEGMLEFRDVVESVAPVVARMREEGADVIVVLSHGGLEGTSYDTVTTGLPPENAAAQLARDVPDIDVIFLGHTHRELADTTINGVLLTQARNWARSLAAVTLEVVQRGHNEWEVAHGSGAILRPRADLVDRSFLDSLRWEHERTVAYVNETIGRATERMDARTARTEDTPILDFVNEVQRARGNAQLSSTAAFRLDAALPEGEITIADVAALYPYDNTLKVIRITGAQLRAYLEKSAEYYNAFPSGDSTVTNFDVPGYNFDVVSGVDYVMDISRPLGERITSMTFEGRPVRDDDTFTLALNNYRQSGGGGYGMIADAPVIYDRQEDIRELLIEEVRRRGVIRPADFFVPSWRLVPEEAAAAARREQAAEAVVQAADGPERPGQPRKRLRVLATNDFHGRLEPEHPSWVDRAPLGGAAILASYFAHERDGFRGPVILLDGGDVMQGTPISNLTQGRSTVDYYNRVGYGGAALGNHEFDWTVDVLRQRIEQAEFPWLSANLFVAGSDTAPSWVKPTAVVDVNGVRVGLIGLSTEETPETTRGSNVAGLEFRDGAAAIDREVPRLRSQGADFVIVVAHAGAICETETSSCGDEIIDWARRTTERPDLIVAGHTHRVARTVENGIPIIETGSYGTRYGVVDLERVSSDSVDAWIRGTPAVWHWRVEPDSGIAALVDRYAAEIRPQVERQIATIAEPLERRPPEYPLGRLIADAQRAAGNAQLAIMNNGGIRAAIDAGPLTWGEAYNTHPFGNEVIVLRITGAEVRAALEHALSGGRSGVHISGMTVYYTPDAPSGRRVQRVTLDDGSALRDDAVYTMAVNDFLAEGGDGFTMLAEAEAQTRTGITDLDAFIAYVQSLPQPVRAPAEPRFVSVSDGRTDATRDSTESATTGG